MLTHLKFDKDLWRKERILFPFKVDNLFYIDKLTTLISSSIESLPETTGTVLYKNGDNLEVIDSPYMCYNYGSPAPYMCKLLPGGYGFSTFQPNDLYKKVKPEYGIQKRLLRLYDSGLLTRYKQQPFNQKSLPENFILVVMQNTKDTVWYRNKDFTILAENLCLWARENKKNILFKWHRGCVGYDGTPDEWFLSLSNRNKYCHFDNDLPLYHLIKNSEMVWTASSMAGIEALICNKPVSIFGESEYMEMATVCETPDDAIKCSINPNLEQWLTYYFKYYTINILSEEAKTRITNRLRYTFIEGFDLDAILLTQ